MENKKIRGTKLYMLKNTEMCFDNDLYSFGVLMLILLYKNMKLIFSTCKNKQDDKKIIIKLTEQESQMKQFIEMFSEKFKEIFSMDMEVEVPIKKETKENGNTTNKS